jgi:hypothetical protein
MIANSPVARQKDHSHGRTGCILALKIFYQTGLSLLGLKALWMCHCMYFLLEVTTTELRSKTT